MLKLIIVFIATLAVGIQLPAQSSHSNQAENGLLWEISGKSLKQPSYLFGTIHLIPDTLFFLPEGTLEAFEKTKVLITEIQLDIPPELEVEIGRRAVLPNNHTVANYLNDEEYTEFRTYLMDSLEVQKEAYEFYSRIKPAFLTGIILHEYYNKTKNYDMYFHELSKKSGKELIAFESMEDQLNIVDSISLEIQFEDFSIEESLNEFERMVGFYTQQNLDSLYTLASADDAFSELEQVLATNRNLSWAKTLKELLPQNSYFIAVGALHLCGENGLVELLRREGFDVKAIRSWK